MVEHPPKILAWEEKATNYHEHLQTERPDTVLSCQLQAYSYLSTTAKLSVGSFWETYGTTQNGSDKRKNSGNCGLEFASYHDRLLEKGAILKLI